ncbi:MAG TPA: GNAT family N-acetyltransferase [Jatrophihabitans sp.]|jgi:ribosomal protein S18 acetylase RimI-like enzyme|nr:GNAT family N-acetyltransferase [Jatrophihabitans sp.]
MITLQRGDGDLFAARLPELLAVYRQAFLEVYEADPEQATRERGVLMQRHAHREGLRVALAEDHSGAVTGFCYTYRGRHGQWWHDVVSRALGDQDGQRWLGNCREVVELHVLPAVQGAGLGRQLLRAALEGSNERTTALSALDVDGTRARRLYRSEGFQELLTGFRFPGSDTRYVILAKDLDTAS